MAGCVFKIETSDGTLAADGSNDNTVKDVTHIDMCNVKQNLNTRLKLR